MSTYPVDIKTYNITSENTYTVFNGSARILGVSWCVPTNVSQGTITFLDDSTSVWVVDTAATNTTSHKAAVYGHIMLPGTGIKVSTSLKVTNAEVTHVTVYYG
jgi:plastocyanin domain-containing protein